jgi:hypothetical protein
MSEITLNTITSTIKSIKNVKKYTINSSKRFIQPFTIPENEINSETVELVFNPDNNGSRPLLVYSKHDIIEVPEYFSEFLDLNKYYVYGSTNLYESYKVLLDGDYLNYSDSEKREAVDTLKNNLLDNLTKLFKDYNYKSTYNLSKPEITKLINEITPTNQDIIKYISDHETLNTLYIDIEKKKYKLYKCQTPDDTHTNIVVLGFKGHLLPLVNIKQEHFTYKDLSKIKEYFSEIKQLDKISNYTVAQLTELATEYKVLLIDSTTKKKKTKQVLYEDIKKSFE